MQALYQIELGGLSAMTVIEEFRTHRLGREIEGVTYAEADATLFADIVTGQQERAVEIDRLIAERLDKIGRAHV